MKRLTRPCNCPDHKTYQAKLPPKPTRKNPHGCAACWQLYHYALLARVRNLETTVHELVWGPR